MGYRKHDNIEDKFWKGATSREEERLLLDRKDTEQESPLTEYSDYVRSRRSMRLEDGFNEALMERIGQSPRRSFLTNRWMGVAASVVIVLGMSMGIMKYAQYDAAVNADTYENPEMAYQEVKKALMLLSSNMNEGMGHTEVLGEFHRAQKNIEGKN